MADLDRDPLDGWDEYRRLVLAELVRIDSSIQGIKTRIDETLQKEIVALKVEVELLKVKSGILGAVGGVLAGLGLVLFEVFKGMIH